MEEKSNKENSGWINKTMDKFVNSKHRKYGNNPIGWYLSGNFIPGEKQEYLLNSMNKWTLKHSVVGITGNAIINGAKIFGGIELLINSQTASSNLIEKIQEIGAGGLFLWSAAGLAEVGVRSYYVMKNKKPIADLSIEGGYHGGLKLWKNVKSIVQGKNEK